MGEMRQLTVTMTVTDDQAATLTAMFDYWNKCAEMGWTRIVSLYVDGNDFKPDCVIDGRAEPTGDVCERFGGRIHFFPQRRSGK